MNRLVKLAGKSLLSQGNGRAMSLLAQHLDSTTGIAVLSMNRPPVNSLNTEMLVTLREHLDGLSADRSCKGIILTSSLPSIFSGGLDIFEVYGMQHQQGTEFWNSLQDVFLTFYSSKKPVIAAINGNAPAGGCLLSLTADYRIFAEGDYVIGLNETKLGLVAPFWFTEMFVDAIGRRRAELALQTGALFSVEKSLQVGLVDEVVPLDGLIRAANEQFKDFLSVPGHPRYASKMMIRQPLYDKLMKHRKDDTEKTVQYCMQESVQAKLKQYVEMLKSKRL